MANNSDRTANRPDGVLFLAAFRWLLLLLFALVLEKSAESVTVGITRELPVYRAAAVYSPLFGADQRPWHWLTPHWQYIRGFLEMFITLLFAGKYFLCLVDPLERFAGVAAMTEDSYSPETVKQRLTTAVTPGQVAILAIITIPEFVLLFHAATSVADQLQWLMFLFLLVVWDSIAFFALLRGIPSLVRSWVWLRIVVIDVKIRWRKRRRVNNTVHTLKAVILRTVDNGQSAEDLGPAIQEAIKQLEEAREPLEDARQRLDDELQRVRMSRPAKDYGPWNVLDAMVVIAGLSHSFLAARGMHCAHLFVSFLDDPVDYFGLVALLGGAFVLLRIVKSEDINKDQQWQVFFGLFCLNAVVYATLFPMWNMKVEVANVSLLAALLVASSLFLRSNYMANRWLWHRHILMLRLD